MRSLVFFCTYAATEVSTSCFQELDTLNMPVPCSVKERSMARDRLAQMNVRALLQQELNIRRVTVYAGYMKWRHRRRQEAGVDHR